MTLDATQRRIARQLARQLIRLAAIADENNLVLGNGGEIGSMLGGIATELEQQSENKSA